MNLVSKTTSVGTFWFEEGTTILHQENDLPAFEGLNGEKAWYCHGKCHRATGPAIIYADGTVEYWIDGKRKTLEQFEAQK